MNAGLSRCIAILLIMLALVRADASVEPRPHAALDGVGIGAKATLVVAALVAAAAVIGVGVYFAVREGHTVKGCAAGSGTELALNTANGKSFVLLGATTGIKAGDLVKVTGTRKKRVKGVTEQQSFVVDKLDRDYGACVATASQP